MIKQFRAFFVDRYDPGQEKTLNEDQLVELVEKETRHEPNKTRAVEQVKEWIENSTPGDEFDCFYIDWYIIRIKDA